jgi:glycolate oxidase iron-sulfur subunit
MTRFDDQDRSLLAACAKCGACVPVCPVFRAEGREALAARGRMHLLAASDGPPSALFADILSRCLLCGACEQVCPRKLPVTRLTAEARSRLPLLLGPASLRKAAACAALARPALLDGLIRAGVSLRRLLALPADSGLRLRLNVLEERPALPDSHAQSDPSAQIHYFTGCFARHVQPSIAAATERLLRRCGLSAHVPAEQCCCGLAAWSSGRLELARALARRNIAVFAETAGPVLVSCSSCAAHLLALPSLFAENDPWRRKAQALAGRVREFSAFFSETLPPAVKTCGLRVFYQDPCHLRFLPDGIAAPRRLLRLAGCAVLEPEEGPRCCGQGGLFDVACPDSAAKIFARCADQALAGQPDRITTACSGCLMQHQARLKKKEAKTVHLAVLLEEALI